MTEQIIQILERKDGSGVWKIRTVIQLWPHIPEERDRLNRFINELPEETEERKDREKREQWLNRFMDEKSEDK